MALYRCAGSKRHDEAGDPLCDYQSEKRWTGRCPGCLRYFNCDKIGAEKTQQRVTAAGSTEVKIDYIPTGIEHFDHAIGGFNGVGVVKGATMLMGGEAGCGKSTLAAQMLDSLSRKTKRKMLYVSGEQSDIGVKTIFGRCGIDNELVHIMGSTKNVHIALAYADDVRPLAIVFDSLQTMAVHDVVGNPTPGENEDAAEVIHSYCEKHKTVGLIINQMGKDLNLKGSTNVPHKVETVLYFYRWNAEDDGDLEETFGRKVARELVPTQLRTLMSGKNRNGEEGRKVFFRMTEAGVLEPVRSGKLELV